MARETLSSLKTHLLTNFQTHHSRVPGVRRIPPRAIGIIALLILANLLIWAIAGIVLQFHTKLVSTCVLAYSLGLRHALDADHISAIDLMTRRLVAAGQQPVTVGTFFSLGHSTVVIVTSIVVAATAAAVSDRFDAFGNVGGIIGSAVSTTFLLLLGLMNAYILYRLVVQLRKVVALPAGQGAEAWKVEGGGPLFRLLKRMFRLIDRPWKMYPLGVLFGLGFDTSSEIALLGIASIQATQGTSIWLILLFPILFTAGMCLVDTIDGALMLTLYIMPMGAKGDELNRPDDEPNPTNFTTPTDPSTSTSTPSSTPSPTPNRVKDPLTFLYYSIILTILTVIVALVIGTLQLLILIQNTAKPTGPFWDGVTVASDHYDVIGGGICASFLIVGGASVLAYKPWRRRVERKREGLARERDLEGEVVRGDDEAGEVAGRVRDDKIGGAETIHDEGEASGTRETRTTR